MTRDRIRVAICGDFPEEGWPSMDRFRAMLLEQIGERHGSTFDAASACPAYARRVTRIARGARAAINADRFCNRFWDYPRHVRRIAGDFDLFHVVDHSYAHLVHALPADRTVVTCHDVDAFRSIVAPDEDQRSSAFRLATRRILTGLQRAAAVTCVTAATERDLVARGIVPRERTLVVHPGVDDVFRREPGPAAERAAATLAGGTNGTIDLLHVGSTIPRKRIDVLLRVCAAVRRAHPTVRLLRVGGPLTPEQRDVARRTGIADDRIVEIGPVDDATLAALYRRAAIVLQPSEREGFGLPLVEALASGTPGVASDIDALREVGGDAVEYCAVGEVDRWTETIDRLLRERRDDPARWQARRERGRARADAFTWRAFADRIATLYKSLSIGSARHIA
ncbi:MAG TPA: glycosyltransferase [Vicinamibacterales bacterium]|nr:glycosyltransferase [Vicinamibacterales bacterium]